MELFGTIKRLWRYPVKSLLGESRTELSIDSRGVVGDPQARRKPNRVYAIQNQKGKFGSGKNTIRFCKIEGLFDFRARYDDTVPIITFPDGRIFKGDSPNLNRELSTTLKQPVTLVSEHRISHFDAGSLHISKTISKNSRHNFGVYAKVIKPGTIRIEDKVNLK